MSRTLRGKRLRAALWLAAGGKCQSCGRDLPDGWHADHVIPWSKTERTNVHEMQALCPDCNLRKGSAMLRRHQSDVLKFLQETDRDRLVQHTRQLVIHVWPGGGKSALPVVAGNVLLRKGVADKIVVVVPRLTLKRQAAEAFQDSLFRRLLSHNLEIREAGNDQNPDRGTAGYVTTYDAIRENPELHQHFFRAHRCLLVLDEVHHVAEGSATYRALVPLYKLAVFRLLMTGTLDRGEADRIAFLDYAAPELGGRELPGVDISYGLNAGVRERANIPAEFHHIDGEGTYIDKSGQHVFFGTLTYDTEDCRDAIHAALKTEYATQLLTKCVEHWRRWRSSHPRSLLLVVCANIRQAKSVHELLARMSVESEIATSDDAPSALEAIKRFRLYGTPAVLVTVAMAYEGMDVKPITHIACLTHIRSFPWLMQMFGRAMRFDPDAGPWESQKAFIFAPDDALMQQAIDYVRTEQVIGVDVEQERPDDDSGGGSSAPAIEAPLHPGVVPIESSATRERASGLSGEEDLGYEQTGAIKRVMDRHNISGSVIDMAALLRELGTDLSVMSPPPAPAVKRPGVTPGDREAALRDCIERLLRRLDAHTKSEFGTFNRKCYREVQRLRPRETLTEQELKLVWRWCCEQAGRLGLETE